VINRKDIEDFILFPTSIHAPSFDQWFRRYALLKLMNAAGIRRWTDLEAADYFEFLTKIQNEISETLNTKHVVIPSQVFNECLWVSCRLTEQWLWPLKDSTRQNFRQKSENRLSF
jgi:hypothetical protein